MTGKGPDSRRPLDPPARAAGRPPRAKRPAAESLDLFGDRSADELGLSRGPRCGQIERWASRQGYELVLGLDEAGRGPLAGPVVAAAAVMPWPCPVDGLDDSKALTEAERERLYLLIIEHAIAYGVSEGPPDEIDRINILQASLQAMRRSWQQVVVARPALRSALVVVDGKQRAPLPGDVEQRTFIKGDARSVNIAAASILAKVTRDRRMVDYHAEYPVYGFDQHKGYPTPAHRAAVARHGLSPIHRRSFRMPGHEPVKAEGAREAPAAPAPELER